MTLRCIECDLEVAHDTDTEARLGVEVLYAPDLLDVDNSGVRCPVTTDEHVPVSAEAVTA